MEYLLERIRPGPPVEEDRQWEWEWKKYYVQPEVLSTTLHDRFNSHTLPIRHPQDFHRDVESCVELAATEEEFLAKLEERKAQHIQEVMSAWRSICAVIDSNSWLLAGVGRDGRQDANKETVGHGNADKDNADKDNADNDNANKENADKENADKVDGDKSEDGDDDQVQEGGDEKNDNDQHGDLDPGNASTAANLSASPGLASATAPSSSVFCLDDIARRIVEGRRRWAQETCAGMLQQRRIQHLAAPTASARTTAEKIAPDSRFCAGIWDPDELLSSSSLPQRPFTNHNPVQPARAAPVVQSPVNPPLERPSAHHQQVSSKQSPEVTETELIAPTEAEILRGEGSGLADLTQPTLKRPTIDDVVREASSSPSAREPMEIDADEEDEDVIMTDAATTENTRPRTSRMAPHSSRRRDEHGKLLRGKRSTSLQQQQNRVKKKQGRRRPSQGTKSSALLDRLLRSTRSSRRDTGSELWYLGDDATACPVTEAE